MNGQICISVSTFIPSSLASHLESTPAHAPFLFPHLVLNSLHSVLVPAAELRIAVTTSLRNSERVIPLLGIVTLSNLRSTSITVAGTEARVAITTSLRDSEWVVSLLSVITLGDFPGIAVSATKLRVAVATGLRDSKRVVAFLSIITLEELRDSDDGRVAVSGIFRNAERVVALEGLVGWSGRGEGGAHREEEESQVEELHDYEYVQVYRECSIQ